MNDTINHPDPIPEVFSSYEEAADFWDTHDTTAYLSDSRVVDATTELHQRHYEVELEPVVAQALQEQAKRRGINVSHLVNRLLRQQLALPE